MKVYFIDASVIMYAVGKRHFYKNPCANVIRQISENKLAVTTDAEVLQEILYRYFYINQKEKGIEIAKNTITLVPWIISVNKKDILLALEIFNKYKKITPRDAIHIAVMLNNNINSIITTDKDFDEVKEINRLDPTDI